MPNKKSNQKAGGTSNTKRTGSSKTSQSGGMQPAAMPHVPTARERAKEMDESRRSNAQTFEL